MSDANNYGSDELEQHLQSSLHDYAPEAPDRLWNGIEKRLSRRRRLVFWWWLAAAGLSVLSAGAVYHFFKERQLITGAFQNIKDRPNRNRLVAHPQVNATINEAFYLPSSPSSPVTNRKLQIPGLRTVPQVWPFLRGVADGFSNAGILPEKDTLPILKVLPDGSVQAMKNGTPALSVLVPDIRTFREKRWRTGFTAGPVWLQSQAAPVENHHTGHATFAERNEGLASGWQAGISVAYHLTPRWRLTTGLSQRQTTQISSHHATLRLMDGVCLNPNDNRPKEYEFVYALTSADNASNVTVHIAQVDSLVAMPDDEPFTLAMHTTRSSTDWVLPFALQRMFGQGRWRGSVQAGGLLTVPGKTAMQVDHFTEQCVDLCFANGRTPLLTVQESGKASLSGLLGVGLEYCISPRWTLSVEPLIFGKKGQTGFSTNIGLSLQF